MGVIRDLTGQRFGRLIVIRMGDDKYTPSGKRIITWDCICDCGNTTNVRSAHLTSGHTWSCGCAHREQMEAWKTLNFKHGRNRKRNPSKSYRCWEQIKSRCYNKNNISYPHYGGKGIQMWDGWINSPEAFCNYVEALDRYREQGTTIDRIDVSKGYEPGNLRWITMKEQQRNKSNNIWITAFGETKLLHDWEKEVNIYAETIKYRLNHGWGAEEALTTSPHQKRK